MEDEMEAVSLSDVIVTIDYAGKEAVLVLPTLAGKLLIENVLPRISGGKETTVEGKIKELIVKVLTDVIRTQLDLGV